MFQRTPGKKTGVGRLEGEGPAGASDGGSKLRRLVQFCESDADRLETASGFLARALAAGEAALSVATPQHRAAIEAELASRGVDVAGATGLHRYESLDVEDSLSAIMADARPDAARFGDVVGGAVARLAEVAPRVRVYTEMADLLDARDGEGVAALEKLWAGLPEGPRLTVLSVHPLDRLEAQAGGAPLAAAEGSTVPSDEIHREWGVLAAIVDSSTDAIISKDLDGIITSWNRGAERLFGYDAAEAIGRSVNMIIPEERQHEEPLILARIRRGERIETFETVRRRKDGAMVDVSLTVSPILDPAGRIVGASKIARDVTDRRRTEARLQASEERYQRLVGMLPAGVYACENLSGTITYYNQQAARIWGRRPRIGDPAEKFCGSMALYLPASGEPIPRDQCPMAKALREGRGYQNEEIVIERPDGSRATVLVNIDAILDSTGKVIGAINVFHDVSALKEAQQALVQQTNKLQTLLDVAPVAVLLAHDRECSRITGNRAAARVLRMNDEENLSLSAPGRDGPTHFVVEMDGEVVEPDMLPVQRAARGEDVRGELSDLVFDDGTVVHQMVSAHPLYDSYGEPCGAVACLLDVTDLKETENRLREADRRKDEFLAVLAHELRNPLAPIIAGTRDHGRDELGGPRAVRADAPHDRRPGSFAHDGRRSTAGPVADHHGSVRAAKARRGDRRGGADGSRCVALGRRAGGPRPQGRAARGTDAARSGSRTTR